MTPQISLLALAAVLATAPGMAAADGAESFKDWTVVCDNLRACEAVGFAAEDVDSPAVLRVSRDGAARAPVKIEIDLWDGEGGLGGRPPGLTVDEKAMPTVRANPWSLSNEFTIVVADAQVETFLNAARNGSVLSIRAGDKTVGQVSLAGMVAALRYVDDRQKRVGTVTALVAKGAAPASSVPAPPAAPVLHPAPPAAQAGLPSRPPAAVKALVHKAECDAEPGDEGAPDAWRLSADKVLWRIPCGGGAYNFSGLFVVVDKAGQAALAPLEGVDDGLLMNAEYDPKTRLLSSYNKGRGVGDCGESSTWAWTGAAFELSEATVMPVCRGYGYDWPTSFRAEVR